MPPLEEYVEQVFRIFKCCRKQSVLHYQHPGFVNHCYANNKTSVTNTVSEMRDKIDGRGGRALTYSSCYWERSGNLELTCYYCSHHGLIVNSRRRRRRDCRNKGRDECLMCHLRIYEELTCLDPRVGEGMSPGVLSLATTTYAKCVFPEGNPSTPRKD